MESTRTIKVKSSQKIFTDTEIAALTGIGLERLRGLARSRHIGFIARHGDGGQPADQWLFSLSDLMVLATLYQRSEN